MIKIVKNAISSAAHRAKGMGMRVKAAMLMACIALLKPVGVFAQSLANTGYDAGTSAREEVATQIAAYVPYVVNLCYALAGVVAIVGAISVYIAMNNRAFGLVGALMVLMPQMLVNKGILNIFVTLKLS